ncbi:MAG: DegT/DnrJ/EryC1/StrS family aminotransferase [Streptomycetaceae bacterium]|jgi:dTDP-4-amino-4,6-dideoxygalactose transaminase|nr:DegT/DnrJ/EryC1/StrS family aminotransferase [Streptomycetaceae bacterium]
MSSSLAALGGKKVREKSFPAWPHYDDTEREALNRVLDSRNWWANHGVEVKEFEKEWSGYTGAKGSFAVTNGTHTLEVIFLALGIGDGDEVIVADWSFLATIGAILTVNAIPKIVDVDPLTGTIDVSQAEAAIGPKTRAIVCVHVAGSMSDMDALTALCKKHGIALIEDSAHAHGSRWKGEHAGTIGDAGSFSFQASKLMTSGEGGVITTKREDLIPMFKSFINCGRGEGIWYYRHLRLGGNYRLSEWQGAILRAQLKRFPDQQKNRGNNANWLNSEIAKIPGFTPQGRYAGCTEQGNYCYVVEVDSTLLSGATRDQIRHALLAEGIPLTTSYPPLHKLEMFKDPSGLAPRLRGEVTKIRYNEQSFPVTDHLAANTLWFNTAVLMGTRDDANSVLQSIAKISEHAAQVAKIDAPSW